MSDHTPKEIRSLNDVAFDPKNPNSGTDRGRALVKKSIEELKTGRSVLTSADGQLIAGEKTTKAFLAAGGKPEDIIVVPNDGTKLVVVQRTDLAADDPRARLLAHMDNQTGHVGYAPNADVIREMEADLIDGGWMAVEEVEDITASNESGMLLDQEETDAYHRENPYAERAAAYAAKVAGEQGAGAPTDDDKLPSGKIGEESGLPSITPGASSVMMAAQAAARDGSTQGATPPAAAGNTGGAPGAEGTRLVQMYFLAPDYEAFLADIKVLAGRFRTDNITDTVTAAVRELTATSGAQ